MIENGNQCEFCVNAMWDPGDNSVGISSCVDDCCINSKTVERVLFDGEEIYCPFFIEQLLQEWELTRCPECHTRHIKYLKHLNESYIGLFYCKECGLVFEHEVPWW